MMAQKITASFLVLVCLLFVQGIAFGSGIDILKMGLETGDEYRLDLAKVKYVRNSLSPKFDKEKHQQDPKGYMKQWKAQRKAQEKNNDLDAYEKFADKILSKWKNKNKEIHARLTLDVCQSVHLFDEKDRTHAIRRKYILSALAGANDISHETELELAANGMFNIFASKAHKPKGNDLAKLRKNGLKMYLHAWKRVIDGIDPNWDQNARPSVHVSPDFFTAEEKAKMGRFASGMAPEGIKDPQIRAKYEAAIKANNEKGERYGQQDKLRSYLKSYPPLYKRYIIKAYSMPPYNNAELVKYLSDYKIDEETKTRIIDAVNKNIKLKKDRKEAEWERYKDRIRHLNREK
jgi:hypothetical protein